MGWTSESPNTFIVLLSHFPFGCVGVLIHVFIQRSCRRLMVLFSWSKGSGRSFYLSIYLSIYRSIYLSIYMRVYLLVHTTSIMYVYIYIHTKRSAIHPYVLCVYIHMYYVYIYIRILYVYGSPHLCLFPYHLLRPQVWFEGARLVEKKGTAAAIFLGS